MFCPRSLKVFAFKMTYGRQLFLVIDIASINETHSRLLVVVIKAFFSCFEIIHLIFLLTPIIIPFLSIFHMSSFSTLLLYLLYLSIKSNQANIIDRSCVETQVLSSPPTTFDFKKRCHKRNYSVQCIPSSFISPFACRRSCTIPWT